VISWEICGGLNGLKAGFSSCCPPCYTSTYNWPTPVGHLR